MNHFFVLAPPSGEVCAATLVFPCHIFHVIHNSHKHLEPVLVCCGFLLRHTISQVAVGQLLGSCQVAVGQLLGSCWDAVRQLLGSHQVAVAVTVRLCYLTDASAGYFPQRQFRYKEWMGEKIFMRSSPEDASGLRRCNFFGLQTSLLSLFLVQTG